MHSCTSGRTVHEGGMTWQKRVEGQAATLVWLFDNETHPFHGMVGTIGNPTGWRTPLSPKAWKLERFVLLTGIGF